MQFDLQFVDHRRRRYLKLRYGAMLEDSDVSGERGMSAGQLVASRDVTSLDASVPMHHGVYRVCRTRLIRLCSTTQPFLNSLARWVNAPTTGLQLVSDNIILNHQVCRNLFVYISSLHQYRDSTKGNGRYQLDHTGQLSPKYQVHK